MAWKAMRIVCSDDAQKRTDRDRRDVVVVSGQEHRVAADVVALLVVREPTAHHHVVGLPEVDLGVAVDERAQRDRCEVVRA
jgi:hypothetical protein